MALEPASEAWVHGLVPLFHADVSEASLLANYAPTTSPLLLDKLARAFARLRDLHQAGVVAYPYSIREVGLGIFTHLSKSMNFG